MNRLLLSLCAAASAILSLGPLAARAAPSAPLHVVQTIPGPDGGWDYTSYDAGRRRIYVTHGTSVLALDLTSGKLNDHFAAGKRLHEVVVVPGRDLLVATDSGDSTIKLLKGSDGSLIEALPSAPDPDGAAYDPATGLVVVVNGDAGLLTLVGPAKEAIVGTIAVGDHLEFGRPDGRGLFYVNVADKGQVAVVDLRARKALRRYGMPGCKRPTGLAYVEGGRIISSCSGVAEILDAANGRILASLKIGGFPDAVLYDPARHLAYVPTAVDGRLWVIGLKGTANNTILASLPTQIGTRTGAVDRETGRVYLPAAQYNLPAAPGHRPTTKPGTFRILVLAR